MLQALDRFAKDQLVRASRHVPMATALCYVPDAMRNGARLRVGSDACDIVVGHRRIRVSHRHQVYLPDIVRAFDFYHSAVRPMHIGGVELVDYSTPRYHDVVGFDLHPVLFPSLAEPLETTRQYIEFARLKEGSVVLDLGAYSGLTSILFDQAVGVAGKVVAVDADSENFACINCNLKLYERVSGRSVTAVYGAVWSTDGELEFSSEGSMGSSAASILGNARGTTRRVKSYTLASLVKGLAIDRVDFIKCDIEGAESVIFEAPEFFATHRPRMLIEVHPIDGVLTTEACRAVLGKYGYECREIGQMGSDLPLLECSAG
jgi:FkbM family methyltransferase